MWQRLTASPGRWGLRTRLLALKAYHPLDRRDFRDEGMYRDGEWIKERWLRNVVDVDTEKFASYAVTRSREVVT